MTALQRAILDRKIEFMRNSLTEIERIVSEGQEKYLSDRISQCVLERQIERLVEAAVDAGAHILKQTYKISPSTYRGTFIELGQQGVIDPQLAQDLAPAAGLRNVITHLYDEVDPKRVFQGAQNAIRFFPLFIQTIAKM